MGCTKVSDGCKNCYAESLMDKRWGKVEWGPTGQRKRTSDTNWQKPLLWNRKAKKEGVRYRVFCASLADVFEDKPDQRKEMSIWRTDLFNMIAHTQHLDWLLLTKRPENVKPALIDAGRDLPNNVWIGTSVENQEQANKRIPKLLEIPASIRFLSMEPLLGPVDIGLPFSDNPYMTLSHVDWVIVGGESGHHARRMQVAWAMYLREQCANANIPFFFKQMSQATWRDHKDFDSFPLGLQCRQFPRLGV
jgi:protein gp37